MHSGASYRLVIRRGPQPNQQFELTRDTLTIGRDITNDIVINDPEISRHHTRLMRNPNGYTVEDLRSTNGTFVNRQRLTGPYQLSNGDLVGLGETVTLAYEVYGAGMGVGASDVGATVVGGGQRPPMQAPPPNRPPQAYAPQGPAQGYAPEEEDYPADRSRWIVIGCGVLTLLFCCLLVGAVIIIDQTNSYCSLPLASQFFYCP
jgi:FHA domain-containing protein